MSTATTETTDAATPEQLQRAQAALATGLLGAAGLLLLYTVWLDVAPYGATTLGLCLGLWTLFVLIGAWLQEVHRPLSLAVALLAATAAIALVVIGTIHSEAFRLHVVLAGVLCLGLHGLALWQWPRGERGVEQMLRERRLVGLALLGVVVGVVALLLFVYLQREDGRFARVLSGGFLAILGLLAATRLLSPPESGTAQTRVMQTMLQWRQLVGIKLGVLGLALLGTSVWLFMKYPLAQIICLGLGCGLVGLTLTTAGLWLLLVTAEDFTANSLRVYVLIVGGLAGFFIAVMTGVQAYLWRDVALSGGMRGWTGDNAWQLWLLVYIELLGLGLMFASVYLGQLDIRTNVAVRRTLFGYNALFTGVLMLAILVILNMVVHASVPYTFEWTKTRNLYSLSTKSKSILESLKQPVRIYALLSQGSEVYIDTRNLLDNCQAYTDKLEVEYVSPDRDIDRYRQLAKTYYKLSEVKGSMGEGRRGVLIAYGSEADAKPAHTFIPSNKLEVTKGGNPMMGGGGSKEYHGEDAIMTELHFLVTNQKKPVIYFAQSNGELSIAKADQGDQAGCGILANFMKRYNFEVRALYFRAPLPTEKDDPAVAYTKKKPEDPHQVPADAKTIVLADPRVAYTKDITDELDRHMEKKEKGNLVVILSSKMDRITSKLFDAGLASFLQKYGVQAGPDFVQRDSPMQTDLVISLTPENSDNVLAKAFGDEAFPLLAPLVVKPAVGAGAGGYTAQPLLAVQEMRGEKVWTSADVAAWVNPAQYRTANREVIRASLAQEPVPVAVAVTDRDQKPRMVVFGSEVFASNAQRFPAPYLSLTGSAFSWLTERPETIGIAPKTTENYTLRAGEDNYYRMIFLPPALMLLLVTGLGLGVWVVRRR